MRLLAFGVIGSFAELAWSAALAGVRYRDASLKGRVSLWMFPIYAIGLGPGFDLVAHVGSWPLRAIAYTLGVWAVEIAVGLPTRRRLWDYSDARWHWRGVIRWDYAPVWAAFGLLLEPVRAWVDAIAG